MNRHTQRKRRAQRGFTLIEIMITMLILVIVIAGATSSYIVFRKGWNSASLKFTSSNETSRLLEEMILGMNRGGSNLQNHTYGLRGLNTDSIRWRSWSNGNWRLRYKYKDTDNVWTKLQYVKSGKYIRNQRRIIARNVVDSEATLTSEGIELSVTIEDTSGRKTSTTTMKTFVHFRN